MVMGLWCTHSNHRHSFGFCLGFCLSIGTGFGVVSVRQYANIFLSWIPTIITPLVFFFLFASVLMVSSMARLHMVLVSVAVSVPVAVSVLVAVPASVSVSVYKTHDRSHGTPHVDSTFLCRRLPHPFKQTTQPTSSPRSDLDAARHFITLFPSSPRTYHAFSCPFRCGEKCHLTSVDPHPSSSAAHSSVFVFFKIGSRSRACDSFLELIFRVIRLHRHPGLRHFRSQQNGLDSLANSGGPRIFLFSSPHQPDLSTRPLAQASVALAPVNRNGISRRTLMALAPFPSERSPHQPDLSTTRAFGRTSFACDTSSAL